MSRVINFRAWDKTYQKMYYNGFYVGSDGELSFDPKVFTVGGYDPLNMEIMQYTGLKDKNGVELCEGDIISNKKYFTKVVSWIDGGFRLSGIGYEEDYEKSIHINFAKSYDVLGNIYQNPELLKNDTN